MTKVVGKQATVTFDVITDDTEAEQILNQTIQNTLNSIVNTGISHLKQTLIAGPPQPKKKAGTTLPEEKYAKENIEKPELIPLGGKWAYAVSIVTDEGGGKSVRIAKGPLKGTYFRNKVTNQMELTPDDPMNPISMVNKVNVKRLGEWQQLQGPVIKRLQAIEDTRK